MIPMRDDGGASAGTAHDKRKRRRRRSVVGAVPPHSNGRRARGGVAHLARGEVDPDHLERMVVSTPEPAHDIRAQIRTVLERRSAKNAVFVARGNEAALPRRLPRDLMVVQRPEGTLLTTSAAKARLFGRKSEIDDRDLAAILGYPESKRDVIAAAVKGEPIVGYEARDARGAVVASAIASGPRAGETARALRRQAPPGGRLVEVSPVAQQIRRAAQARQGGIALRRAAGAPAMTPEERAYDALSTPQRRAFDAAERRATAKGMPGGRRTMRRSPG
jgi:hypothetical protein